MGGSKLMLNRRVFLRSAVIAPLALPVMAKAAAGAFKPTGRQIAEFVSNGRFLNGVPFFTGFKPAQNSNKIAGQWLVAWTPLSPLGDAGRDRSKEAPTFCYASVVLHREDVWTTSDGTTIFDSYAVEAKMRAGVRTLARVVDENVEWRLSDWHRYREFVRYVERGSYVESALRMALMAFRPVAA
jgi:hypothetical protein